MAANGKSLGLAACTAIVVGNMVGSGFYLSPAAVAPYGNLAIIVWIVMGAGAICLGLTFAKLARLAPVTGGPYAYTRLAYGDFPGFLIAWGYWISIWASLPVIAVAFAGVMINLFPMLAGRVMAVTLRWVRSGPSSSSTCAVSTPPVARRRSAYAKLLPFGAVALLGLFFIDLSALQRIQPQRSAADRGERRARAAHDVRISRTSESATVPAGDVRNPEWTIPRSTVIGISIAATLYVLGTIVVMGVLPREQLVAIRRAILRRGWDDVGSVGRDRDRNRRRPFIDRRIERLDLADGPGADGGRERWVVSQLFGRLSARNVPAIGIIVSALLATALVLVQAFGSQGFASIYRLIVGLSTMTAVVPYAFCALAGSLVSAR